MEVGPLVNCKTTKQKLKIHELGSWLQPGYVKNIVLIQIDKFAPVSQ